MARYPSSGLIHGASGQRGERNRFSTSSASARAARLQVAPPSVRGLARDADGLGDLRPGPIVGAGLENTLLEHLVRESAHLRRHAHSV
ncbi:hypothetical protein BH20ACT7_BH20ACT7_02370 [soil metagenome]